MEVSTLKRARLPKSVKSTTMNQRAPVLAMTAMHRYILLLWLSFTGSIPSLCPSHRSRGWMIASV